MSEYKDVLESTIDAAVQLIPRMQNAIEQLEERAKPTGSDLEYFNERKEMLANRVRIKQANEALAFVEECDEEITKYETLFPSNPFGQCIIELNNHKAGMIEELKKLENYLDTGISPTSYLKDIRLAIGIHFVNPIHTKERVERRLSMARENYAEFYERSPEELLQDMCKIPREVSHSTAMFCRLFDFKTELDGFDTGAVIPTGEDARYPAYIGGEFSDVEYFFHRKPDNFVWVALNKLGTLASIYNSAINSGVFTEGSNELIGVHDLALEATGDLDLISAAQDMLDEGEDLKEALKQLARPIMQQVVEEAHEKYGAYRNRVIASVENKQREYGLSDAVVSEFSERANHYIGKLIANVEDEFSEETQFSGDDWGIFQRM